MVPTKLRPGLSRLCLVLALTAGLGNLMLPRPAGAGGWDAFVGEVSCGAWDYCLEGCYQCAGQLLPIAQYQPLFSLNGTRYGGNGTSTFALPNLAGRTVVHQGSGPGLTVRDLGATGGAERVALTEQQMPPHAHGVASASCADKSASPAGACLGTSSASAPIYSSAPADAAFAPVAVRTAGAGQPHNNMQPYLVVICCIAVTGVLPVR